MRAISLGLAVFAVTLSLPAAAHADGRNGLGVVVPAERSAGFGDGRCFGGRDNDRRGGRRSRDCVIVGGGLGYLDYGDYDANRSFDPDRWNDWWHERPMRAYPAWMSRNENCQRQWWSGGGWRC